MKRIIPAAIAVLALALGGALFGAAGAASADEAPQVVETDTTPYVLAAWVVGDLGNVWGVPQTLKTSIDLEEGNLNALDGQLGTCGVDYQVDLYLDDETTTALLAGGVLYGPSNPAEHLAHDAVQGNPWKYVDNASCPEVVDLCPNLEGSQDAVPTGYDEGCNPPTVRACETFSSVVTTDLSTWNTADTDSLANGKDGSGEVSLTSNALHVATADTGHRKAAAYYPVDFPLSQIGDFSIDWSGTASEPGGQVVVSLDGDATPEGILVVESLYGGINWLSVPAGGTWVSRPDSPHAAGGGAYPNQGTFDQWLAASPSARVLGIGVSGGSGVTLAGDISKITVGCTEYTFAAPVDLPTPPNTPELAQTGANDGWLLAVAICAIIGGAALTARRLIKA